VRPALIACLLLAVVGCDSGEEPEREARRAPAGHEGTGVRSYEGRVIRGWLLALDRGDYGEAAYYFAPGAIVDQGRPIRLRDEADARAFNASLPCRAKLAALEDEGPTVLATFDLREGPGGPCSGQVRVRYTIKNGKFTEWRQLEEPEGEAI
jgi:hypothetical protein